MVLTGATGALALAGLLACVLPSTAATAATTATTLDGCGYSASSFTESTVMRWAQINGFGTNARLVAFANDEKGLLLGVNGATTMASATDNGTNGQTGADSFHSGPYSQPGPSNPQGGSTTEKDPSGRVFYPALYITNLTAHPLSGGTAQGDFQNGGSPRNISGSGQPFVDDIFGSWSTATKTPSTYTVTPPPKQNNWNLGTGSDTPVGTTFAAMGNEGFGAEVRWNVSELKDSDGHPLIAGNQYRFQVIEHDGDQNKTGGDAGEFCVTLKIPGITTNATSGTLGNPIHDVAHLSGSTGTGSITFNLYPGGANCTGTPLYTKTVSTNGDGDYASGDFTPTAAGTYQWQATYNQTSGGTDNTSCGDPNEKSTIRSTFHPKPGIKVLKLASVMCADLAPGVSQPSGITPCHGTWSKYTRGVPTLLVPSSGSYAIPVKYQIRVTNTGKTPLTLTLSDPRCDPGTISGPVSVKGTLTGKTLSAGGKAFFTCTHTLTQNDPNTSIAGQPFTNTARVTGKPPNGVPVHGHSKVTVHRKPKPKARKFCRSVRTGKRIFYTGSKKPAACLPSKPPHHGHGFTG